MGNRTPTAQLGRLATHLVHTRIILNHTTFEKGTKEFSNMVQYEDSCESSSVITLQHNGQP
jgi:hypothetical protein